MIKKKKEEKSKLELNKILFILIGIALLAVGIYFLIFVSNDRGQTPDEEFIAKDEIIKTDK